VSDTATPDIAEAEALRAEVYALLARLLYAPPDAELLETLRGLQGDDGAIGAAVESLAAVARSAVADDVEAEYQALFVGIDGGELNPYASSYRSGLHYAQPLLKLRGDMARLGIARRPEVREPEDHIAFLCDAMAGLITGKFGTEAPSLAEQQAFFTAHVADWAPLFFEDLEAADAARFYMPVGRIGRLFLEVERQAFQMAE
jgi:TorA maturation chaperone TorD